MNHEITPHYSELEASEIREAMGSAGQQALASMEKRYGSGHPMYHPGTEATYTYHGANHGAEVGEGAALMAEALILPAEYQALAKAAGQAHDAILTDGCGVKLPRGDMELQTATFFGELLEEQQVPAPYIKAGELAILGTRPCFDEQGSLIGQAVEHMEFPDSNAASTALCVASADLVGTFSIQGPIQGLNLYKEDHGYSAGQQIPFDKEGLERFYQNQITFMEGFTFPHPLGDDLFGSHRGAIIEHYEETLEAITQGDIHSIEELERAARLFYEQHKDR